jgi:GT2 family glycosyltransferase
MDTSKTRPSAAPAAAKPAAGGAGAPAAPAKAADALPKAPLRPVPLRPGPSAVEARAVAPETASEPRSEPKDALAATLLADESRDLIVFDEAFYVKTYADVTPALKEGRFATALDHFKAVGQRQGRAANAGPAVKLESEIEQAILFKNFLLVAGWSTHPQTPMNEPAVVFGEPQRNVSAFRFRRPDVARANKISPEKTYGFLIVVVLETARGRVEPLQLRIGPETIRVQPEHVPEIDRFLLAYLGMLDQAARVAGDHTLFYRLPFRSVAVLQRLYKAFIQATAPLATRATSTTASGRPLASLVFVQCGTVEYLPCLLPALSAAEADVELIIVNNSPNLRDQSLAVLREAELLYGFAWQYVEMPTNVGFGPACNKAAETANGRYLLFHNNDVAPSSAEDYRALLGAFDGRTGVVGARQVFPSGAIMHDGLRVGLLPPSITGGTAGVLSGVSLGRGGEAELRGPVVSSGSLLGVRADLFARVGGFSSDYLFGHFEDVDLGLRLEAAGHPTRIVEDCRFIHAEGGGSILPAELIRTVPTLNRIIFTRTWTAAFNRWGPDAG